MAVRRGLCFSRRNFIPRTGSSMEKWEIWHQKAIQAGVNPELAQPGLAVIRDYWEHGKYRMSNRATPHSLERTGIMQ